MKFWLTQFKISAVLDTDSPSSQSKCRSALSEEDRHFAETIQILDRALSNRHPALERPSDLDFAIMNAVRTSHRPNSGSRANRQFRPKWSSEGRRSYVRHQKKFKKVLDGFPGVFGINALSGVRSFFPRDSPSPPPWRPGT